MTAHTSIRASLPSWARNDEARGLLEQIAFDRPHSFVPRKIWVPMGVEAYAGKPATLLRDMWQRAADEADAREDWTALADLIANHSDLLIARELGDIS